MMARKTRKPYDPAEATKAALERQDREREIERLKGQGATVTTDRAGHIVSAWRSNVFRLLLERRTITLDHHNAAEWLAELWAAWKGLDGQSDRLGETVDGGSGSRELVSDRMIQAGKQIAAVFAQIGSDHGPLLAAFMVAVVEEDRPMSWRGVVERETGLKSLERQTEAVVVALEELREYYQGTERRAA